MSIHFKDLNRKSKVYKQVKNLYNSAFPKEERAPFRLMMRKSKKDCVNFYAAFDDEKFVGLAYIIHNDNLAYLFYLAVDDTLRGKGYGSLILSALKERYSDKNLFLALEEADDTAPNAEQRKNRRKFYEKNGFKGIPYKMKEATVIYDVMSTNGDVTPDEYETLITKWSGKILKKFIEMRVFPKE